MRNNTALDRLRAHIARHNRYVAWLSLFTTIAAAGSWALLYFVACWFVLLALSIAGPADTRMPPLFPHMFVGLATGLCLFAWFLQWRWPDQFPRDRKPVWEIILDFLLVVPRMTLAIWGTIRAWQHLNTRELSLAVRLLQRIEREETL